MSAVTGETGTPLDETLKEWAFAQSPCLLAIFDAELRLVRANAGMKHALSLTEGEMRGLRLPEIAPGPVSDAAERGMRLALETGETQYVAGFVGPTGTGAGADADKGAGTGTATGDGWTTSLAPLRDGDGRVRAVYLAAHGKAAAAGERPPALTPDLADARVAATPDGARPVQERPKRPSPGRLASTPPR